MPTWCGVPVPITRMLGEVDQDDPTNLPPGCAAVCRNTDFTRDSTGGALSAVTRAGNCMIAAGALSPGTGLFDFQYESESATDPYAGLQMLTRFTLSGIYEYEQPSGTGHMKQVGANMFAPPAASHRIDTQAGNILWSGYSNLKLPTAGLSGFNPKTLNLDPLGMKPYGWRWLPSTAVVYKYEVATPSNQFAGPQGNGHTYQAQNNGATGPDEPIWPTGYGATVTEALSAAQIAAGLTPVTWREATMVIANRLPAPPAPVLTLAAGGAFPSAQTVRVLLTLLNAMGETVAGLAAAITTTGAGQEVQVQLPTVANIAGWLPQLVAPYAVTGINVYEADVPSGNPAPPQSAYLNAAILAAPGSVVTITASAAGPATPPSLNTARITPGQLPSPSTSGALTRVPAGGTFAAGRDVWIRLSFSNTNGETPLGPSGSIINTLLNDALTVDLTQLPEADEYPQLVTVNVYEADVATGTAEPPISAYALAIATQVGQVVTVSSAAAGQPPVTVNGTGPGGNVVADTEDGGINGTQGYRYAVPAWVNRNETVSGFTLAAVSRYIVDEDGWEISVFDVPIGPANIVGRLVNWTVADGTQDGPFFWIGLVNLLVPSQNLVYPQSFLSDGIEIIPTVFLDNVTTTGTFNFTDEYLIAANDTTDRLRVAAPPAGVRVDYIESCDRIFVAGAPGYQSGPVISLGADYESFYGDTSPLPIPSSSGETYYGAVESMNRIFAMRSMSGWVITPGQGDPASWDVQQRWKGTGPCGPRAFAAVKSFLCYVHQSGFYRYQENEPDLLTKEIPRRWGWINWAAASTICVAIDEDTHTVRLQVPVGRSTVPNMEFCVSYLEGWLNPIHFSTFSQKEISQEAARRWSFNDISAYVCKRILRTVPNPPAPPDGPTNLDQTGSDFYIQQLAYTSIAPDGLVNARTPGRFDDNGAGIDWQYQTVSAQDMQKPCKPEGVVTSGVGYGAINASFLAGRQRITDQGAKDSLLRMPPMQMAPDGPIDWTRKPSRRTADYWSVLYDNGKVPGNWASIKKAIVYVIPVKQARGSLDTGGGR